MKQNQNDVELSVLAQISLIFVGKAVECGIWYSIQDLSCIFFCIFVIECVKSRIVQHWFDLFLYCPTSKTRTWIVQKYIRRCIRMCIQFYTLMCIPSSVWGRLIPLSKTWIYDWVSDNTQINWQFSFLLDSNHMDMSAVLLGKGAKEFAPRNACR